MNRIARTTLTTAALAGLALSTTACGGDDDTATPAPAATVTVTEQPADDRSDGSGGDDDTSGSGRGGDGRQDRQAGAPAADPAAAVRTALADTDGTVVGVDPQVDGTWEVEVVGDDGTATTVVVSADGARATDRYVDDTDADDVRENQALLDARVAWAEAAEAAGSQLDGAPVDLDLGEEDGRLVWEVSTAATDDTSVLVDATSGSVLGVERD